MPHHFRAMQPITLCVVRHGEEQRFASLVLDYADDEELIVGVPMRRGEEMSLQPGETVGVEVLEANGVWLHRTRVRRRTMVDPPALVLEWPSESTRTQRRNDVRVETARRAELRVVGRNGSLSAPVKGVTLDLSAGGTRLSLPETVDRGTMVEITLDLPEVGLVQADGRVLRWGEIERGSGANPYWVAVEFTRIDAAERRELTKFVFNVQREQMRKGLS